MDPVKTVRLRVRGLVQGVGFRAWLAGRAGKLGVSGWVRNRRDGSLEALLTGAPDAVDALILACRQGPPSAQVDDVATDEADPSEASPGGFEQLPTA